MSIIVDLTIVALIALFTFIGYKKGLIKVGINILSFFIAIIIAFIIYKPVSNFIIENTLFDEKIETVISGKIGLKIENGTDNDLPNIILEEANNVSSGISKVISIKIMQIIILLILFIIIKIILRFISVLADAIGKLPIIKQFNKAGGTIYGVLKGLIIVYLILAIISFISPLIETNIVSAINESYIGNFMYNNNILLKIIFQI